VAETGLSFRDPNNAGAKRIAQVIEEQIDLAVEVLEMIKGYIGDPPLGRESFEEVEREMERLQRELDAEKG
jgi:hypothetical protein